MVDRRKWYALFRVENSWLDEEPQAWSIYQNGAEFLGTPRQALQQVADTQYELVRSARSVEYSSRVLRITKHEAASLAEDEHVCIASYRLVTPEEYARLRARS